MSEDRTHDVEITKPMHYQLRYHRHVLEPTESPQQKTSLAFRIGGERAGELDGCAIDSGPRDKETMEQWTIARWTMGQWTMGHWDNGNGRTGHGDNAPWDSGIL